MEKIGHTTGFLSSMVDVLLEDAKKQGYVPDASVAGDDVINGARPKPFMVYRNMDLLELILLFLTNIQFILTINFYGRSPCFSL
jgi:hypothetical protein